MRGEEENKVLAEQLIGIVDLILEKYKKVYDFIDEKDKISEVPQLLNEVDNAQLQFKQVIESENRDITNQKVLKDKLRTLRVVHQEVTDKLLLNYDAIKLEVEKINKIKANKNPYTKENIVNPAFFDNHS